MNEKKVIDDRDLDKVAGGDVKIRGVYRCVVCQWELPNQCIPLPKLPKMLACKKCGGKLQWYERHDEV